MTRHIGAHVSIAGGVQNAPGRATEIGANALGIFTKNQRQWKAKDLTPEDIEQFGANLQESGITQEQVVIHASYLINLGNPEAEKREQSIAALLDEAQRAQALGLTLVNFHPGSGLGKISEAESIAHIAQGIVSVLEKTTTAVLVIEATAGQGAHVGYTFTQLAQIIDAAGGDKRIGVCIDTCHIFSGGYEVRNAADYRRTMDEFARLVGTDRLVGIHLNDSLSTFASRHDRHASIGKGELGIASLARFVTDPNIPDVPFVLETPNSELWSAEIKLLSGIARGEIDPDTATIPT